MPEGRVLDLMSSWVSHLPRKPSGGLVALGMNAVELAANPMADQVVVQDLNIDPSLPFEDASFDAVLCCVSIDYLVCPVEVLREAARVLRPRGVVVLTPGPTWSKPVSRARGPRCAHLGRWAVIRCTPPGHDRSDASYPGLHR